MADDAPLFRQGLIRLLRDANINVVGQAGEVASLLAAVEQHDPVGCRLQRPGYRHRRADRALTRVAAGQAALDPTVVRATAGRARDLLAALSERERDVLALRWWRRAERPYPGGVCWGRLRARTREGTTS